MTLFEGDLAEKGYRLICGIDEVGRGALAGPVVAAAVILPLGCDIRGVRDSKLLTPRQREHLFNQISKEAVSIGIGQVDGRLVDTLNVLQATLLAMSISVQQLQVQPEYLLVDALTLPEIGIEQKGIVHGDNLSISIAAASIMAKVTRDRLMCHYHTQFPAYGFNLHKGYGTVRHLWAIQQYGPCHIHRRTFRGVCR